MVQAVSYRARTTETQGSGLGAPDGSLAACRTEVFAGVTNHRFDADFPCRIGPIRESTDLAIVGGQMETRREPVRVPGGRFVRRLLVDETGQDLIEYALLAGSIGLVGIAAWQSIVTGIGLGYQGWDANMQAAWEPQNPVTP